LKDASLGVRHAIEKIEEITGRRLLDERGEIITPERKDGSGVDAFVATSSASPPLRLILAGLMKDLSLKSALRAANSTYAVVEGIVSLESGRRRGMEEAITLIQRSRPDAILIVGGTEGGATKPVLEIVEAVALARSLLEKNARPCVIFAGNSEVRSEVVEIIGGEELYVTENVRPSLEVENISPAIEEIESLYTEIKIARTPGFDTLSAWSSVPIMPTSKAFGYIVRYLASLYGPEKGVMGVDVGSSTTTVAACIEEEFTVNVRSDLGVCRNASKALSEIERVLRWLPFEMGVEEASNIIMNKKIRPTTVPQTRKELLLEHALAREVLREALVDARKIWPDAGDYHFFEPVIGRGGVLSHVPHHGEAALTLLDSIEPVGVTTLVLDLYSLAAPLGALASLQPLAAVQVLNSGGLVNLGTVVVPFGKGSEGRKAILLKIAYEGGGELEVDVPYGSLEVVPLPFGQEAILDIRPMRMFDIGWGRGRAARIRVKGGTVGLIIDARGRPLILPSAREERKEKIRRWLLNVGA
jgi:hypothetical protein